MKCDIAVLAEWICHPSQWVAKQTLSAERLLSSQKYLEQLAMFEKISISPKMPSERKIRFWLGVSRVWVTLCPGAYKLGLAHKIEECLKKYDEAGLATGELAEKANKTLEENKDDNSEELAWARGVLQIVGHRARMKVGAVALSLEVYRIDHGNWPETLTRLEYPVANDPFTGGELQYRPVDSGCVIYSVGENQKDGGGKSSLMMDGDDDIVFHLFDPEKRNKR